MCLLLLQNEGCRQAKQLFPQHALQQHHRDLHAEVSERLAICSEGERSAGEKIQLILLFPGLISRAAVLLLTLPPTETTVPLRITFFS